MSNEIHLYKYKQKHILIKDLIKKKKTFKKNFVRKKIGSKFANQLKTKSHILYKTSPINKKGFFPKE